MASQTKARTGVFVRCLSARYNNGGRPSRGLLSLTSRSRQLPVYEYRCTKGHTYEKTEGFSAPATQKCTQCGARARRQISMPAVIFKGSGFYSTDNRGSGPPDSGSSSSDGASSSTPSDNGKASPKSDKAASTDSASKSEASVD